MKNIKTEHLKREIRYSGEDVCNLKLMEGKENIDRVNFIENLGLRKGIETLFFVCLFFLFMAVMQLLSWLPPTKNNKYFPA